jgi:Flp pilus assembly protein TadG
MRARGVRRWGMDQGSTLVEFSLIAFMFIIVLVGIVEMGRMVLVYTTVANAARAGARYAIVHGGDRTGGGYDGPSGPGSTTQVETVVKNFASAGLLNTANLGITVAYPGTPPPGVAKNSAGLPVTVTVTYPYDPLVRYFNALLATTMGSTSEGYITF